MTFQQLQYMLEVYNSKAVSQAANNLYVSPSSISNAISALEEELGIVIFIRKKNGMVPTPQGMAIIECAAQICSNYQQMTHFSTDFKRHIRLSFPNFPVTNSAFTTLYEELMDDKKVILSNASGGTLGNMINRLKLNEINLGIRSVVTPRIQYTESQLSSNGMTWKTHGCVPVMVLVGPNHKLYDATEISPSDLDGDVLIDSASGPIASNYYFNTILNIHPERTTLIAHPNVRYSFLEKGYGYSVCLHQEVPAHYHLRLIPLRGITYTLISIVNPAYPFPPEADRFLGLFESEFEKHKHYLLDTYNFNQD